MTEVTSYTELIAGIDAGRVEMGLRHLDFEVLCSMTQGHWGKAAGQLQAKRLGPEKIFDALRAAGLRIRLEVDPEQRAKMIARSAEQFNPMQKNQARAGNHASPVGMAITSRVFKYYARKGGKASMQKKSREELVQHQKNAANARWKRYRKKQAKRARQSKAAHKARKQGNG